MTPVDKSCQTTIHLTPEYILAPVRRCLGGAIQLDPATEDSNPTGALRFFTEVENGLAQPWVAGTFVNPPYGWSLPRWTEKIHREAERGFTILSLLPGSKRTETDYWQEHVWCEELSAVCFIRGRVSFLSREGVPQKGNTSDSAIYGYGIDPSLFVECFGELGACFEWEKVPS